MYDDSGFTLIEVVFTISIILILSTITLHFVINSKPVISFTAAMSTGNFIVRRRKK